MEAFIGPRQDGLEANHKDGDKKNNSVENLEYVTQLENMLHAHEMGLVALGINHGMSKLCPESVREIRRRYNDGNYTMRAIAKDFEVVVSTIWKILNNVTWSHIQ